MGDSLLSGEEHAAMMHGAAAVVDLLGCSEHGRRSLSPEKLGSTSREECTPLAEKFWANCDPNYLHGPDAETFSDFIKRVEIMKERITTLDESFVAIFSHGYVIKIYA